MSEQIKKVLSQSPQKLEEKILKAIFKKEDCIVDIIDIINEKMFTISEYSAIYTAMVELYKTNNSISDESIQLWLENNGIQVNPTVIQKLYNETFSIIKIEKTAQIIKELYQRRTVLEKMHTLLEEQESKPTDFSDILERINDLAMSANDLASSGEKDTKCCSDINQKYQDILLKLEDKKDDDGIYTNIPVIDNNLGGLKRGKLYVLVGDSGSGKSALALQLGVSACNIDPSLYTYIYSLEMEKEEVEERDLAMVTGIEPRFISDPKRYFKQYDEITGTYTSYKDGINQERLSEYKTKISDGLKKLNSFNLYIDDTPDLDITGLIARIKKNNLKNGRTDIIILDHIGILTSGSPSEVVGLMDEAYNKLKQVAKKLNCAVIVLHQFSNEIKQDPLRVPNVFSLRGSGAPRHYADVIATIYRPCIYPDVIAKNPELKNVCELAWHKVRYTAKPDTTDMSYNGYSFTQKEPDELKGDILAGKVYIDSNGEIIINGNDD